MAGESFRSQYKKAGFDFDISDAYFCASPKQRTVETAMAFGSGFFPGETVSVQYKGEKDFSDHFLDPEFLPMFDYVTALNFDWDAFRAEAIHEMAHFDKTLALYDKTAKGERPF